MNHPKEKEIGLTIETFNRRKRRNIITFLGEFVAFIIESLFGIAIQLIYLYHDNVNFVWFVPFLGKFSEQRFPMTKAI